MNMMELIILITLLVMLVIATGYDLKWRYVPDYASYSFIGIAIIERILYALELNNLNALSWAAPATLMLGGFGYLLYRAGMWGGGDVKIITSTAILLSWFPGETIPLFIDFFMNLMILGAVWTLPIAVIIGLKNKIKPTMTEKILMIIGITGWLLISQLMKPLTGFITGLGLFTLTSINYLKRVEKKGFIKPANMKTLMDGDWLTEEVKVGRKTIKPRKQGLTKKEAEQIKKWWRKGKLKKKPLIKEGIAYLPAFLLTYAATILMGNLMIITLAEGLINGPEMIMILK
ncbi:hypothetical protein GF352_00745 [archaeon]|nr:hypothetical protein [archaeon]